MLGACGVVVTFCLLVVLGQGLGWAQASEIEKYPASNSGQAPGQAQGKELPDAPGESKKEPSANPAQQIENRSKQAAEMTEHAATAGLIRARNWESTWIEGVYVRRD